MNGRLSGNEWIYDNETGRIVGIRHPDGSQSELVFQNTNRPTMFASVWNGAEILPYRCVTASQGLEPFSVVHTYDISLPILGVTDNERSESDSDFNAMPGEEVSFQNAEFVQVTCSEDYEIEAGQPLMCYYGGYVVPASTFPGANPNNANLIALENATYGQVFWARQINAWTISGGVAPVTGGVTAATYVYWNYADNGYPANNFTIPGACFWMKITCVGGGMNGQAAVGTTAGRGGSGGRMASKVLTKADWGGLNYLSVRIGGRTAYGQSNFDGTSYVSGIDGALVAAPGAGDPGSLFGNLGGTAELAQMASTVLAGASWTSNTDYFYGSGGRPGISGRLGCGFTAPGGGGGGNASLPTGGAGGAAESFYGAVVPYGGYGGQGGQTPGANGSDGPSVVLNRFECGAAGGGGAYNSAGAGGNGGAGYYGAGGGGGGGGTTSGGIGGLGGTGVVVIHTLSYT